MLQKIAKSNIEGKNLLYTRPNVGNKNKNIYLL